MYRGRFLSVSIGAPGMCALLGLVFSTTANAEVAEKPAARVTVLAEVLDNISTSVAVERPTLSEPSRTAMSGPPVCANLDTGVCDAGIGIQGGFEQFCNDDQWTGLAFPIQVGGCGACPPDQGGTPGEVDPVDLAGLLGCWGPKTLPGCECFDADGENGINPLDLATLLGSWGPCPLGPAATVDTLTFTLRDNRAGGDIYLTLEDPADCQPDSTNILASLCCAISGLPIDVENVVHFDPVEVPASGKIWVVFVERTGLAELADDDDPNSYNGDLFPGSSVRRDCQLACTADGDPCAAAADCPGADNTCACSTPSAPGRAFANLEGTGNPGDWTDLHDLGANGLGNPYCMELTSTGGEAGVYDCVANPDPIGACCNLDGASCEEMPGYWCGVNGSEPGPNPAIFLGNGTTCDACLVPPKACTPDAGDCCAVDGNGTPGCDNNTCCNSVCIADVFCCDPDDEWGVGCAGIANDVADPLGCATGFGVCAAQLCAPLVIATGAFDGEDGYLSVAVDRMGSWAHSTDFGGGDGEFFNPAGAEPLGEPMFGGAINLFSADTTLKEVLSCNNSIRGVNTDPIGAQDPAGPGGLIIEVPTPCELPCTSVDLLVATDEIGADGVDDTVVGVFTVSGSDWDLRFETWQQVEAVGGVGSGVSTLTQTYTITNNGDEAVEFNLVRLDDYDLLWGAGSFADDVVGTSMNGAGCGGNYMYQMEDGQPETAITVSSDHPGVYSGSKGGLDPDNGLCVAGLCVGGGSDGDICFTDLSCAGPAVPWGFGTDQQEWDAGGVPPGWGNIIAHVPDEDEQPSINGESGPTPEPDDCSPCDGKAILSMVVSLGVGEMDTVTIVHTYGQTVPAGCE